MWKNCSIAVRSKMDGKSFGPIVLVQVMKRWLPILSVAVAGLVVVGLVIFQRKSGLEDRLAGSPGHGTGMSRKLPSIPFEIKSPPRESVFDWDSLNAYQNTISASRLRTLIEGVFTVGDTWKEVIEIQSAQAKIVTSSGSFVLHLLPEGAAAPERKRYWKTGQLEGLHIAIDPGHIGGDFAGMEERQFGFPGDKPIREGEMALQTAHRLKPLLERMGAQVSLVRSKNEPVTPLRTEDFLKLFQEHNPGVPDGLLMPFATQRFYRRAEIVERARIVNEVLRPDVVLCLHYNASSDSGDWADPSHPILVEENHFHMLLNGAYTSGEVLDEGERFQMMERILQGIHEREAAMAGVVAKVFAERTGLPAYQYDPDSKRAVNVEGNPYLWARNLLANRSYTCPVLYFEPWVMNNTEVYARMQEGDYDGLRTVGGREQPSIMMEYATCVAAGIEQFFDATESH